MNQEERNDWYKTEDGTREVDYSGEIPKVDHENIMKMASDLLECSNFSKEVGNEK